MSMFVLVMGVLSVTGGLLALAGLYLRFSILDNDTEGQVFSPKAGGKGRFAFVYAGLYHFACQFVGRQVTRPARLQKIVIDLLEFDLITIAPPGRPACIAGL